MSMIPEDRLPVLVAGARTAFLESAGLYGPMMSYELGAQALSGLMQRTPVSQKDIGMVIMGTVVHETNTTNVAREAMLSAGLDSRIPAYTVAMAGISPNVGVANICDMISLGRIDMGIASGVENFSDVPVRVAQGLRRTFMKLRQGKTTGDRLKAIGGLRPRDFLLDIPSSSDFTTRLTMGSACEAMAKKFGTTREEADAYAAMSHARAIKATDAGLYQEQITPVTIDGQRFEHLADNTARRDASSERLAKLPPAFDRENGIITAGNASRFTDGSGALLLSSLGKARENGLAVQAIVRDYQFTGVDSLHEEMLLGPAMSIPRLLQRNGLTYNDIDVWEIHEAFATQILVNRHCMASSAFINERFGSHFPVGEIPLEKLNIWGGSLSLGNPFAATGVRLFMTAAQRLRTFKQRYAVISTCAGGGLGAAILLENGDAVS